MAEAGFHKTTVCNEAREMEGSGGIWAEQQG